MPDEASTPPADTQAPPSEPVSAPVVEPASTPEEPSVSVPEQQETPAPTEAQASVAEPEQSSRNETGTGTSAPEPTPEPQQSNSQPQTTTSTPVPALHGDIAKARAAMQDQKRKKLDKIMARLSEKGKITNDEVEKLLRVSDATATRYLDTLEKEGRVRQEGKTGKGVLYVKM